MKTGFRSCGPLNATEWLWNNADGLFIGFQTPRESRNNSSRRAFSQGPGLAVLLSTWHRVPATLQLLYDGQGPGPLKESSSAGKFFSTFIE
jgi:hypothetical protein